VRCKETLVETNADAVETVQNASRDRRDAAEDGATKEGAESKLEMEQSGQQVQGCLTPIDRKVLRVQREETDTRQSRRTSEGVPLLEISIGKYTYR
jgi:hypothetical protein